MSSNGVGKGIAQREKSPQEPTDNSEEEEEEYSGE